MKGFGLRLENLREKSGYSKVDVSLKLGFTANVYGSYEREERRPALETIVKLSELYNVSLDYLVRGKEYEQSNEHRSNGQILAEVLKIFADKEINSPYFLQPEKWAELSREDIKELSNHFEWIVHKAKS